MIEAFALRGDLGGEANALFEGGVIARGCGVEGGAAGLKAAAAVLLAHPVEGGAQGLLPLFAGRLQAELHNVADKVGRANTDEAHRTPVGSVCGAKQGDGRGVKRFVAVRGALQSQAAGDRREVLESQLERDGTRPATRPTQLSADVLAEALEHGPQV